jgi:hypothetical protein
MMRAFDSQERVTSLDLQAQLGLKHNTRVWRYRLAQMLKKGLIVRDGYKTEVGPRGGGQPREAFRRAQQK